jgi:hypothetical protein
MKLEPAQIQYLKSTLGVKQVLLPVESDTLLCAVSGSDQSTSEQATQSQPEQTQVGEPGQQGSTQVEWAFVGDQDASVYLLALIEPEEPAKDLLRNILKAIGDMRLCFVKPVGANVLSVDAFHHFAEKRIVVFTDLVSDLDISSFAKPGVQKIGSAQLVVTKELAPMLSADTSVVKAQKRRVWADLKPLADSHL